MAKSDCRRYDEMPEKDMADTVLCFQFVCHQCSRNVELQFNPKTFFHNTLTRSKTKFVSASWWSILQFLVLTSQVCIFISVFPALESPFSAVSFEALFLSFCLWESRLAGGMGFGRYMGLAWEIS